MPVDRVLDFILQRPNRHGKRSFAIVRRQGSTNRTLKLPDLDVINQQYKKGVLDFQSASKMAEDIRDRLYKEQKYNKNFHPENKRILDEYWKKRFEAKDITDKKSAYNRLRRAIESLEDLSLLSAPQEELQKKIHQHRQQRTIAAALNEMLVFFGRQGVKIPLNKKKRHRPKYLTESELQKVLSFIECEDKKLMITLSRVAFGTGLRLGEIYGLEPHHLRNKNKSVHVDQQLRSNGLPDDTKTSDARDVPVLSTDFQKDVFNWITKFPTQQKKESRTWRHAEIIKNACIKAFPLIKEKHCVFHDLRHSYAAALLLRGFSISDVAACLGNSLQVCQEYYSGFNLQSERLEVLITQLNRKKA